MTQGNDVVSVIVPAYNAAATIGQTLESCLAQTHRALEVIVVDDGSTDATAEIVRSFAARDPRIRLLQQENAGVAAARNLAIAHAQGDYVAPLDADDLWHPEKVEAQVATMRRGGQRIGVAYCWWRRVDMAGLVTNEEWRPYPHEGDVYTALIMGNFLGCSSVPLIRRTCLAEIGGYDPGLRAQGAQGCEDLKLYLQLAERYQFALVPRFLVGYRVTLGNMSSDARQMLRSQKIVLAEARRHHPSLPARLFRLAEARCEYQRGRACVGSGMLGSGLTMLLNAVRRDPIGVPYRFVEGLHRLELTRSWQLRGMGPRSDRHASRPRNAATFAGEHSKGRAHGHRSNRVRGLPFLSVPPEPVPHAPLGSTLYGWRCDVIAASLAGHQEDGAEPAARAQYS